MTGEEPNGKKPVIDDNALASLSYREIWKKEMDYRSNLLPL